ncbi:AlpA family phage regulatory protein [Klebsiella pasteurii]|uniref:AlpA family phage regulatory protein n=1 Tax=Klebsiella pasteurii TaxID=2587529 RepID=A0ABT5CSK5_9ENTR|nr:AlpA family phage regulatory protein [Klebsiella pasteurii]MDC0694539.1 AlpA family phage regulatory protein [Klebsiella pasteurii]MDC0756772.1 AlpA family phage regulatory protein [Klebsiella pasteurii]MDQ2169447.1 AlpA family phage regulatory protein [Klebsiella pasteurii]MDQ2202039.1 AlpA family phage regulatory protein [Klebsiella pasteurii]MDQ2225609.1 AlpA family phage regulatory protein [Klebsiella pasteurii]
MGKAIKSVWKYRGQSTDKWFYKLIKDGEFPKPIKLGRSSRWTESEVKTWLKQRIEASRGH